MYHPYLLYRARNIIPTLFPYTSFLRPIKPNLPLLGDCPGEKCCKMLGEFWGTPPYVHLRLRRRFRDQNGYRRGRGSWRGPESKEGNFFGQLKTVSFKAGCGYCYYALLRYDPRPITITNHCLPLADCSRLGNSSVIHRSKTVWLLCPFAPPPLVTRPLSRLYYKVLDCFAALLSPAMVLPLVL